MSEYIVRIPSDIPYEIKAELNAWYVNSEPIVRCRDCIYFASAQPETGWCARFGANTEQDGGDGFCAWGERNDGKAGLCQR